MYILLYIVFVIQSCGILQSAIEFRSSEGKYNRTVEGSVGTSRSFSQTKQSSERCVRTELSVVKQPCAIFNAFGRNNSSFFLLFLVSLSSESARHCGVLCYSWISSYMIIIELSWEKDTLPPRSNQVRGRDRG